MQLTWNDLIVEDLGNAAALLEDWDWLVKGQFRPIIANRFGDWFLGRPDGRVEWLSMLDGELVDVAASAAEFEQSINSQTKQEEWLLSLTVFALHERGLIPGPDQCYAYKIPPALGGSFELDNVEVMDWRVYSSICGQLHRQLKAMAPGSKITGFVVNGPGTR